MRHYLLADPLYYERIERYQAAATFSDVLAEILPDGWKTLRDGVWLHAQTPRRLHPKQGFKIHVSAVPKDAVAVLRAVAQECVRAETAFKCAGDPRLHRHLNSKRASRGSSGKFITIYPKDDAAFLELIERIADVTRDYEGPYILSDRRYPGSRSVFYRYGGFAPIERVRSDGSKELLIEGADGTLIPDVRQPYFVLPEGIVDPVRERDPVVEGGDDGEAVVIAGRYEVEDAIAFSNSGGVYLATDRQSGEQVVLKEARPLTSTWSLREGYLDAVALLRREYDVLRDLEPTGVTVEPVDLVQEWEHTYLALEFVRGEPLRTFRAKEAVILTARMHDPAHVVRFSGIFRALASSLVEAVRRVHEAGYIIGDLSPNNVMIDAKTFGVTLIDMESAHREEDVLAPIAKGWYTPGFRPLDEVGRRPVTRADDLYAAGMSLYSLVIPVQPFFEFNPSAVGRFMDRFVAAGLPREIRDAVDSLVAGDAGGAREVLDGWTHVEGVPLPTPAEIDLDAIAAPPLPFALA